jgi:hypothetical protein
LSTRRAADVQDGMVEFKVGLPSDRRIEFLNRAAAGSSLANAHAA